MAVQQSGVSVQSRFSHNKSWLYLNPQGIVLRVHLMVVIQQIHVQQTEWMAIVLRVHLMVVIQQIHVQQTEWMAIVLRVHLMVR